MADRIDGGKTRSLYFLKARFQETECPFLR